MIRKKSSRTTIKNHNILSSDSSIVIWVSLIVSVVVVGLEPQKSNILVESGLIPSPI